MANTKLKQHQMEGIIGIQKLRGNCLLADDMRLGKTIQSLWWCSRHSKRRPIIVVCKGIGKYEWEQQAKEHVGLRAVILEGQTPPKHSIIENTAQLYIINYDIIQYWCAWFYKINAQVLIMDEVQALKNRGAKRTKAVRRLSRKIPYRIALSGTPLTNRPAELWSVLNIIRPDLYPAFMSFAFKYCKPKMRYGRWDFTGASNLDELHHNLSKTIMIRRLRKNITKEKPKLRKIIPIKLNAEHMAEYREAEKNFIAWLTIRSVSKAKKASGAKRLTQMGYLRRLASELKMEYVYKWIDRWLKNHKGKLAVYGIHKNILQPLHEKYQGSLLTDGRVSNKQKHNNSKLFNTSKTIRLWFANIKAAGDTISLRGAEELAFIELDWVPGNHMQVEDRIVDMAKTTQHKIYYLVAAGTIEEDLCRVNQKKQEIISEVLDGKKTRNTLNIYDELEKAIKKRANK